MTLHLLSPLDGRYAETTAPLRDHFSEFAFLRDRVHVELNFLPALSKTGLVRPLSDSESAHLESVLENFSDADAELILEYERKTRHDVKAIEYFIQSKLQGTSLEDLRTKTRLTRITNAGLIESHPHDVIITKEAPNYQLSQR